MQPESRGRADDLQRARRVFRKHLRGREDRYEARLEPSRAGRRLAARLSARDARLHGVRCNGPRPIVRKSTWPRHDCGPVRRLRLGRASRRGSPIGTIILSMGTKTLLTVEQFMQLPEVLDENENRRFELEDGEVIEIADTTCVHNEI